jgi:hypothetical protein
MPTHNPTLNHRSVSPRFYYRPRDTAWTIITTYQFRSRREGLWPSLRQHNYCLRNIIAGRLMAGSNPGALYWIVDLNSLPSGDQPKFISSLENILEYCCEQRYCSTGSTLRPYTLEKILNHIIRKLAFLKNWKKTRFLCESSANWIIKNYDKNFLQAHNCSSMIVLGQDRLGYNWNLLFRKS